MVRASRNIEEDQLIGSLLVVKGGQLDRVACIAQVEELGSLDDAAIGYIEAGDDTFGEQNILNFGLFHGNRLCRLPPAHQGIENWGAHASPWIPALAGMTRPAGVTEPSSFVLLLFNRAYRRGQVDLPGVKGPANDSRLDADRVQST